VQQAAAAKVIRPLPSLGVGYGHSRLI